VHLNIIWQKVVAYKVEFIYHILFLFTSKKHNREEYIQGYSRSIRSELLRTLSDTEWKAWLIPLNTN